jgi:hypothetical protein
MVYGGIAMNISTESYVPVSRGLRQHLSKMSGNAAKLYLELLLSAEFRGPNKGRTASTFAQLGTQLRMNRQSVHAAAKRLRPIYIDWEPAKNQHDATIFTVQKYKSVEDFAFGRRSTSNLTANEQRVGSDLTAPPLSNRKQRQLRGPNKFKNLNKAEKQLACWSAIGICACGPIEFQEMWEKIYRTSDHSNLAGAMGECLDRWDEMRNERPNPAEFCKALDRIRRGAKTGHRFTIQEIPELEVAEWAR